jgi:hypothetical protein
MSGRPVRIACAGSLRRSAIRSWSVSSPKRTGTALERMVMLGEAALSYVIHQYLAHYHTERNHQGLDNQRIAQEGAAGGHTGPVVRRERLGGLLSYSHREAA